MNPATQPPGPPVLVIGERRRRDLASAAKRLRVAVMTDPARSAELADTLIELVGNRLLAWSFVEAAADAPDSVVLAARILAERGPLGPYASTADAVRYFTAAAQLAAVQAGLGQPEAAGRTLDALDGWRSQLGRLPLLEQLSPAAIGWALVTRARAAADLAVAAAFAEAALLRLYAGPDLGPGLDYLLVAAHLAAADARWSAGDADGAVAHHQLALGRYRTALDGLDQAVRPAVAQAALAPLAEVFGGFGHRAEALGDRAVALQLRREWLALAERFDPGGTAAGAAGAALSGALLRAGREFEAEAVGVLPSTEALPALPATRSADQNGASTLPSEQALGTDRLSVAAAVRLRQAEQTALAEHAAARSAAEAAEQRLRVQAEQAAAALATERAEAERRAAADAAVAEREAVERARLEAEAEAERRAALAVAERAAAEERRRERAAAHEPARVADPEAAQAARAALPAVRAAVAQAGPEPADQAAAQERLAEVLRPLAIVEPDRYREDLLAVLESLVSLRWRLGDADGSREAARELKTW
ncbi:MAG: hypothetical protein QM804_01755 [Propionicimonas sp.]